LFGIPPKKVVFLGENQEKIQTHVEEKQHTIPATNQSFQASAGRFRQSETRICRLSQNINWIHFESEMSGFYARMCSF